MKIAFITPTRGIRNFGSQGDFQLALSHLLDIDEPNSYEKELLATGQQIILDNGLFENHQPEGIVNLIKKTQRIKATHFFAPDHLYDAKRTLKAVEHTIYNLKRLELADKIKIAAVIQGKTEEEFFWLYDELQKIPEIDLIGLSILAIPRCFGSFEGKETKKNVYQHDDEEITPTRIKCLKKMIERGNNKKNCHLLGLGSSLEDVIFAKKNCPWVVSHDSSSMFWSAIQGKKMLNDGSIEGGKSEVKVDFDFGTPTKKQLDLAQDNINLCKKLLQ